MDIRIAWKLENLTNTFRIPIRVTNPKTDISIIKYCLFDTGFSGYLGLTKETILQLGLERIGSGRALSVNGLIEFESFAGNAELIDEKKAYIANITAEQELILPIQNFEVNIIGIKSIVQFNWLIGKKILILLK